MEDFEFDFIPDSDDSSIKKVLNNDLGEKFLKDFTEAWNDNFLGINYFDLNQYGQGQMNGFVLGFVKAWKRYNT